MQEKRITKLQIFIIVEAAPDTERTKLSDGFKLTVSENFSFVSSFRNLRDKIQSIKDAVKCETKSIIPIFRELKSKSPTAEIIKAGPAFMQKLSITPAFFVVSFFIATASLRSLTPTG